MHKKILEILFLFQLPYFFDQTLRLLFFTVRFSAATTQGQLLFEGGIYSVGKPADSNDG